MRLHRVLPLLYPLLFMALIFAMSSVPGTQSVDSGVQRIFAWTPPQLQNLAHIPIFGILAWLWCRALCAWSSRWGLPFALPLAITLLYGLLDEWHQLHVPGRYASASDLVLNTVGACLGVAFCSYFSAHCRRCRKAEK